MAVQKLKDNGTEIEFSPLVYGYVEDIVHRTNRWRTRSGEGFSYQFFTNKWHYEIPVIITVKADADQINTWARSNTELTFYYDLINEAAATKTVHIISTGAPLQMMSYTWESRYEGIIVLEEI